MIQSAASCTAWELIKWNDSESQRELLRNTFRPQIAQNAAFSHRGSVVVRVTSHLVCTSQLVFAPREVVLMVDLAC